MKLLDLFEARRNPSQNPKLSAVEFIRQYKDNPHAYLHLAPILKVGIYPKSSDGHDSPIGIYAFRIMDIWENDIERWNTGEYKFGLSHLSYHGGNYMFILESNIDPLFPDHYTKENLNEDIEKLKKIYGLSNDTVRKLMQSAKTNLNFVDMPVGYLWGITKAMSAGIMHEFDQYTVTDTKKWNSILRSLGYSGFNDPGYGYIHGAEHQQALFLTKSAFNVIDVSTINQKQREIEIERTRYKGIGRVPKDLHVGGIGGVLFSNHTPADFAKVRKWTVDGASIYDLRSFKRFLPWNAQGIIKNLYMGGSANESYENGEVKRFFDNFKLPKNIKIESISVGRYEPWWLLRLIPEDFPVDTITISPFASTYGIDKLPEKIQKKIVQPSLTKNVNLK